MNAQARLELHERISSSEKLQAAAWLRWKGDVKLFVEECVWSYDPRRTEGKAFPIELWPKQRELLDWMTVRFNLDEEGAIVKSRDTGVSWTTVEWATHRWIFYPGFKATWGSQKAELVDNLDDPDSLFEKVRFLLRFLPSWLMPTGFDWTTHSVHRRIVNPENHAILKGVSGDEMGRAGRSSIFFLDEAAFIERAEKVEAAIIYHAPCRIYLSNPNGMGNLFARKVHGGTTKVFSIGWEDDPRKSKEWYEAERKAHPDKVGRELDRDFSESDQWSLFPHSWLMAAREIELSSDGWERTAGLDVAEAGPNETVLLFRRGPVVERLISWRGKNTTQTAMKAAQECRSSDVKMLLYDSVGVGAGVRGTLETGRGHPFAIKAVNAGSSPSTKRYGGKPAKEAFTNARGEMFYGILRSRFRNTWERVVEGTHHEDSECISLLDDPILLQQLGAMRYEFTLGEKVQIEPKKRAAGRGIASPDRADALALAFFGSSSRQFNEAAPSYGTDGLTLMDF